MGHKTHPIGFRLGVIKGWQSRWFAGTGKQYSENVVEDWRIREVIRKQYAEAGISRVEIERSTQDITINVHTARPGIVIGRGGQRVDELRKLVEGAAAGSGSGSTCWRYASLSWTRISLRGTWRTSWNAV